MEKIPLIAVVGPTASGKTSLAIELAKQLNGEIISADSMQIYKGMPIASAVPTEAEKQGIPHHLMEFLNPEESFSVADYVNLARKTVNEIYSRGKQPILVGGTGLYVNSLIDGTEFVSADTDLSLRACLEEEFDRIGAQAMLEKLREIDGATAKRLHPNDRRRIIRAFEVYNSAGINITQQNEISKLAGSNYNAVIIGINYRNRNILYERIEQRVDIMLQNGLIEEAYKQFNNSAAGGAKQAIGHKELFGFFAGEEDLESAVSRLKTETRHYAKRQLTWFRKREDINWIYADEQPLLALALEIIKEKQNG